MIPSLLAMPANIVAPVRWVSNKLRGRLQLAEPVSAAGPNYMQLDDLNAMMRNARVSGVPKPAVEQDETALHHPNG